MVNKGLDIIKLIKNPDQLTPDQAVQLNALMRNYPFFQPLYVIYTRYLKKNHLFYKNALQQTAARTIDRSVLYEMIELGSHFVEQTVEPEIASVNKIKQPSPVQDDVRHVIEEIDQEISTLESSKTTPVSQKISASKDPLSKDIKPLKTALKKDDKKEKQEKNKLVVKKKMSYTEWIKEFNKTKTQQSQEIFDVIDKFLRDKPKITPSKDKMLKPPAIVEKSVQEKQMLMTETLANLYVKQKKYDKAIQAFKILSLKYPKKSSYFANRIKEIKKHLK